MPRVDKPWYLESVAADGSHLTHPIHKLPFRVGRDPGADLSVDARGLSRQHAEFQADEGGALRIVDLDSTNGTWVNKERVREPRRLAENDVIHFGNAEYRLGLETATRLAGRAQEDDARTMMVPTGARLTENFVPHAREFRELLAGKGLACAAQPIVAAQGGQLFAYELLGRCEHPALREPPGRLFDLARKLDLEAELSAAFRRLGITQIAPALKGAKVFVNTHPSETFEPAFLDELKALRALPGAPDIVVEVHETAVVEIERMRVLAQQLQALGLSFAYDDFGAGQSRLNELGEVPPHFVKFDMPDTRHRPGQREQAAHAARAGEAGVRPGLHRAGRGCRDRGRGRGVPRHGLCADPGLPHRPPGAGDQPAGLRRRPAAGAALTLRPWPGSAAAARCAGDRRRWAW